ncbi:MAG TPA: phosphoglycerate dehydrogenase [Planctomycetota bacterium]|nr:phosphoglycerate dehydrogenase [Planctomycetota bacterium]
MPASRPFRVLVADSIESEGLAALRAGGLEVDARRGLDEPELCTALAEADALLVRSRTTVTAKALEAAPRLKLITRAGIGVDNVDLAAASRRGVIVSNVPDASTTTTAELAIALLMALARRIAQADRSVRAGRWERTQLLGSELAGKTLGIVGFGRIGRVVADRALGLKMRVVAHDPFLPAGAGPPLGAAGVALVDLETLLRESDFLTVHAPLTEQTRGMIGAAQLARAKPGLRVVNAARGGIVDETALVAALASGAVGGAALDVFDEEPLPADSPLRSFENVLLTPHLGASTEEAQRRVALEAAAQIVDFARTGSARSAVNYAALPDDLREELAPYLELSTRLGLLAGRVMSGRLARLELLFRGERFDKAGERATAPLRAALLAGILRPALGDDVSPVNAALFARERGIELLESREPRDRDYVHRVVVEATFAGEKGEAGGARRTLRLEGTCFGRRPRLVGFDGVPVDAELEGDLILTRHHDKPGQIGRIGTLLGARGVNLAKVDVGSLPERGPGVPSIAPLAVAILSTGALPDAAAVLRELRSVDGIVEAHAVRLPRDA